MPPSTSSHQSISGVFAESYSPVASPSRHSPSPQSSLDGRSVHDELLSPRQAPTPEMAGPSSTLSNSRQLGVDSPLLSRAGLDEDRAVTSGAKRGVTDEDRRGSTLVARTPRVPAPNGFDDRGQGIGTSARVTKEQGGHLRRRSSMSNMQTSLLMDDVDISRTAKTTPGSAGMERAASLTTFMKTGGGLGATRAAEVNDRAKAKRAEREAQGVRLPIPRRKLYSALLKLSLLVSLSACVFYVAESVYAFFRAPPLDDIDAGSSRAPWLQRLQDKSLIFDTLETVPYPVKTHPRSPHAEEKSTLSLADYLLTRLGSHFSFPSKNLYSNERGSQLWLTTATVDSVELANRHLVTFFQSLGDADPHSSLLSPDSVPSNSSSSSFEPENSNQWRAQRAVVTLCRDVGCMEYCRKNPRLFCYNGFVPHRNPRDPLDKAGLHAQNADEIAKLRGILETLETGRRVFWVDSGTYLRRDPVPYMGDLATYDLQIPDGWSTGNTDAGIAVFNPSQRVISLLEKMLEIARLPLVRDRTTWASTNLLLDPSGEYRNYEMTAPRHAAALDENLYDDDPDQKGKGGYGQKEFESSWDGGLDVRVLDPRYFHSSTGRLGRRRFKHEQQKQDDMLYFHCVCCGDPYQQDYIAGALGYHQAALSYDLTDGASRPTVPLVLKAVELKGTTSELRQAMSLLLQITAATGRTFVPPLTVTLVEPDSTERELYIWRAFLIALWAHPNLARLSRLPDRVKLPPTENLDIKEPAFVMHAAEHLRRTLPDQSAAARLADELQETLTLDLGDGELTSLQVLIERLRRPFWSTERTIALENFEAIRNKEEWRVADIYADVTMCNLEARPAQEGGKTCAQLCPL